MKEKNIIYERSLLAHREWHGKLEMVSKVPIEDRDALALAYTPGVAEPCRVITKDPDEAYQLTWKDNVVAVVSDGTAVLGLGNIGGLAGLPVMEGKSILFKEFANINAVPICMKLKDQEHPNSQEIIDFVKALAPSFGGINLEDLSAPHCVEVESALQDIGIPVFHDDQHGTAIVVAAAMMNAAKAVNKDIKDMTFVISGTGAAGSAIIKMLHRLKAKEIYGFNINGIINKKYYDQYNFLDQQLSSITNSGAEDLTLTQAMKRADAFIGVSAPNVINIDMVRSMKPGSIVFAMANPTPEIGYDDAVAGGARIVGTGRSDYPNQVNNLLAFPGVFRGALDCRALRITENMKLVAAYSIASLVDKESLKNGIVLPSPLDPRVVPTVAEAVMMQALKDGVARL